MTIRTHTALTALFADNITGDISPADLRDFLDSTMGVYGSLSIGGGSTAQALLAAAPELMTEWLANGVSNGVTPAFGSNNITIDNAGTYEVAFQMSFDGVTGDTFEFTLEKNGSPLSPVTGCRRKTSGTDVGSCSFVTQIVLAVADILTIEVESSGNGSPVWRDAQLAVKRIA